MAPAPDSLPTRPAPGVERGFVEALRSVRRYLRFLGCRDDELADLAHDVMLAGLPSLQALELRGDALRDADCGLFFALPALRRLHVRGGTALTGAGFAKAGVTLLELTFESCQGLTAAGLRHLAREGRWLQTLRLLDCDLGADWQLLAELPAFASLQQLTLRGKAIRGDQLAPLLRTKLRSLQLVDVPVTGRDLAPFAELPSLRTLDDGAKKDLLKLRARIAVASGAGEEEARVLEQIVALDPLDGEAIILLGQYHARRGEPDLAILQYERAAGITAAEADAKVRHAQLLVGQARCAEALPLLRRAQQVKPRENIQQFLDLVERIARGK